MLGSLALEVTDLLSGELAQAKPVTVAASAQLHPHTYTSSPPAPPSASVPVVGVTGPSYIPAVPTIELKSDEETTPLRIQDF